MGNSKGYVGAIAFGAIIFLTIILGFACTERIPAGYVGVVYSMNGGVAEQTLGQGWHMISPTKKVTRYSIGIEQSYLTATDDGDSPRDDSFSAPSKDGKGLQMELTFTYRFKPEYVAQTFTRFKGRSGSELLDSFIKPNIISWTKEVTAKYPVTDILGEKRAELNTVLTDYLAKKFEPYGIIIETASLINIEVDDETRASITKKVTAQQALELAQVEKQTAEVQAEKEKQVALIEAEKEKETAVIEAEKVKINAEAEANRIKIKAEADAEAVKIAAEAQAKANQEIAESLTPELIEKIKLDKWNGSVPTVQGNASPIVKVGE